MRMPGIPAEPSSTLALLLVFLFPGATGAQSADEMRVEQTAGAVKVRQGRAWESPAAGMVIHLPAVISTGADGAIRLRQSETLISVAANTAVELLPGPAPGQPLQRVVQKKGSAFYDVESQKSRNFRVETPWLVAVIKGTQFDVTVAADTATVALYQGSLSVEAPDSGDAVGLSAGQIAKRHRDQQRITVVDMDDGEPVERGAAPVTGGASRDDRTPAGGSESHRRSAGTGADGGIDLSERYPGEELETEVDGAAAELGLEADADPGGGDFDLTADGDVYVGDAGVDTDLDADADLGDGDLDLTADGDVDLADAGVDTDLDADADLSDGDLDLTADGDLDLGDADVDAELDADADLDEGEVDVGADVIGVDADLGVDADGDLDDLLDADVDLGLFGDSEEDFDDEDGDGDGEED